MTRAVWFILLVLLMQTVSARNNDMYMNLVYGGSTGTSFDDSKVIGPGQIVHSVTIRSGERVNGVGVDTTTPSGTRSNLYHGGGGGKETTLTLNSGEYVTNMEIHVGTKEGSTRVVFVKFTTSSERSISGGTPTSDVYNLKTESGFQLSGFFGASGKELDSVGPVWTRITPSSEEPGTVNPDPYY
ncbi:unnamed protein product [Phytophthora lilii]|uniref:Unnamed protein product n=1 Tax=Phytophthora lilii TaxID=2077276 RepID=A0A9W6XF07_9STRA|nr:unnamed protein product [Phytophthora lilii]